MSRALFICARLSFSFLSVRLFHVPFDSYVCRYFNTLYHFTFEWRDSLFGCFFGICNIVTSLRFKCCHCFFVNNNITLDLDWFCFAEKNSLNLTSFFFSSYINLNFNTKRHIWHSFMICIANRCSNKMIRNHNFGSRNNLQNTT